MRDVWGKSRVRVFTRAAVGRLRKMYVEEKLKAEVVAEALAKKW